MSVIPNHLIPDAGSYRHLSTRFDPQHGALWCFLRPLTRSCFTFEVLEELRLFQEKIKHLAEHNPGNHGIRFVILASRIPGVFNFGGDLPLFIKCLRENDPETLRRYAKACIDVLYAHASGFHLPITTISLLQGEALGGGFEAALASDILIAEKQARMGFPEVLFNLFPGMGAYNLLSRRIGVQRTERMLLTGKLYRAEDLRHDGVVDILAEDGRGEGAVYDYILRSGEKRNAHRAIQRVRRRLFPLRYDELLDVAEIWVDTAMRIGPQEIRLMERLARSQERLSRRIPVSLVPPEGGNA